MSIGLSVLPEWITGNECPACDGSAGVPIVSGFDELNQPVCRCVPPAPAWKVRQALAMALMKMATLHTVAREGLESRTESGMCAGLRNVEVLTTRTIKVIEEMGNE